MSRRSRLTWLVSLVAVLSLAAVVRVAHFRNVILQGELVPQLDGDSSYHLHRIEETLRGFPSVPHFDPGMNWPTGAFCPWADGFDLSAAAFALLAGGGTLMGQRIAIALWPAIFGVLVVAAAIRLTQVVAPGGGWRGAALAAGVVTALLPDLLVNSRFGRIDHHVAEALVLTLLATWALKRLPAHPSAAPPPPLRFELEGALCSALAVWTFSGSPLYVALAALPMAWAAFRHGGQVVGSGGPGLVAGGLLAAALSAPAIADIGRFISFKFPSLLQPILLVAAGVGVGACGWAGRGGAHRTGRRLALTAGLLAVSVALVVAIAPRAVTEVDSAITGWLLHRDAWLSSISEFKPAIRPGPDGRLQFRPFYYSLAWVGFAMPAILLVMVAALRRRPRVLGLAFLTTAMLSLALVQNRFSRVSVPLLGAVVGLTLAATLRRVGPRRGGLAVLAAPVLALATLLADFPVQYLVFETDAPGLEPVIEMALDLRDQPPPSGRSIGVLSNWTYGHHLQVQSGLPVVVNGFGSFLDEAAFWEAVEVFQGSPAPFDDYLLRKRIGAVVAGAATVGNEVAGAGQAATFRKGGLSQGYMASVPLSPLLIAGSGVPNWNIHHLPHLMPRAASLGVVSGLAFPLPFLWSFERVEGAVVRGVAPGGQRVVAELDFVEHGRPHTYKAWVDPDADGRWSLRLPFPSGLTRSTLRSGTTWRLTTGGGAPREFALSEAAVRGGFVIELDPSKAKT